MAATFCQLLSLLARTVSAAAARPTLGPGPWTAREPQSAQHWDIAIQPLTGRQRQLATWMSTAGDQASGLLFPGLGWHSSSSSRQ